MPDGSDAGVDLQCLSNLDYALSSVGATAILVDAAEGILMEAATRKGRCEWGTDRKANAV